ncbi:MAG: ParB/RepB/Spo0J family partition protein [Candidatus Omnitrophota bacterium]|nr:ParB/RepB/Spo0J family partition protein [Candidatus Omnitrophota bacterium]
MERRALGKGLSALIPEKVSEESVSGKKEIMYVAASKIKPNPFQPREEFDQTSIDELSLSIKEKGVIQPLLVRRKGDYFELIAGERRFRAANSLGLNELPVIIRDADDQDSLELALIENIQREELNPIEEAHAYQHLVEKFSVTQEKISDVLGKSRVSVANTLRLLKLPHEIQEEMKKGRISFAHGRALLEVEDVNYQRKLVQDVISKGLSVRELESLIKSIRPKTIKRKMKQRHEDPVVAVFEERLQHSLATKVRIVKNKKRGHINIEFYSQEDLERIVNVIKGGNG